MTFRLMVTSQLPLLLTALILVPVFSCSEDSGGGSDADTDSDSDSDSDSGQDTDSWLDDYNMPFNPEPFAWENVPGGLDQPTEETLASNVLLVMFFQKW
ncbi:MAG: hypothetical protein JRF63_01660 [Deltaproteobacteria bacterium]|nr:hypothetical protein [Deltaproteobacteria bacterium]